jgi:magnesium-transporting ATPase (P-type)
VLDALAACKVAALDKTGTLTTGELVCTAVTDIQDSSKRVSPSFQALPSIPFPDLSPLTPLLLCARQRADWDLMCRERDLL